MLPAKKELVNHFLRVHSLVDTGNEWSKNVVYTRPEDIIDFRSITPVNCISETIGNVRTLPLGPHINELMT
jgi:hypothetical protein